MATEKQKAAFEASLENNGNVSQAMREAGYSDNYAKNPQDLKKSKGWQELLDEYIPEDLLQQKLKEGLDATRTLRSSDGGDLAEIDFVTRHKYLDTAFKLRGSYAPEKHEHDIKPTPILNAVHSNNSNEKDTQARQED